MPYVVTVLESFQRVTKKSRIVVTIQLHKKVKHIPQAVYKNSTN